MRTELIAALIAEITPFDLPSARAVMREHDLSPAELEALSEGLVDKHRAMLVSAASKAETEQLVQKKSPNCMSTAFMRLPTCSQAPKNRKDP